MIENENVTKQDSGLSSRPLNCSADALDKDAERETDEYEYREGDIDAFFGCDPDFTGGLTTEEHLQKIRSGR